MLGRIAKVTIVMAALVLGLLIGMRFVGPETEHSDTGYTGGFLSLTIPAFAQDAHSSQFPNNEVGICAYVKLKQTIDLSRADAAFKGIEADEAEYIIGSVELADLAEDMWPHVYISSSGWIMAYYPRSEPTSRIVQWVGYQRDNITTTTLRDTLVMVNQKLGLSTAAVDASMGYYHFQYPEATKLLIAVDTTTGTDTFTYTIPSGLNLHEASWSHYAFGAGYYGSYTEIDSERICEAGSGRYVVCGTLGTRHTSPGIAHEVQNHCDGNWVGTAIVFLHQ